MESLLAQVEAKYKALRPSATEDDVAALRQSVKTALREQFLSEIGRRVKAESITAILFGSDDESG